VNGAAQTPTTPANLTRGNGLIYALWVAGLAGVAAVLLQGWNNPIAGRDFAFFWVAGKLAASGHAAQAYDLEGMRAAAATYGAHPFTIEFPYPPHILLLAAALASLPLTVSFFVWQAVSGLLFYIAARPYLPDGMPRVLAVLTPSALLNIAFGQTGFFYGALWLWCFSGSAIATALLTFKPQLGSLAAVEALRGRFVIRAAAIAILVLALSILFFGFGTWRAFFEGAATNHLKMIATGHYPNWYVQMTTPLLGYGLVGWLAFAGAAVFLLTRRFDVFTAATATFLIAPYGFHYDMTVVCLGFGVLLFRRWRDMSAWQTLVAALCFLSPVIVRAGTWLVPPLLLVGLFVLTNVTEAERVDS
jgi:hypothetical protein